LALSGGGDGSPAARQGGTRAWPRYRSGARRGKTGHGSGGWPRFPSWGQGVISRPPPRKPRFVFAAQAGQGRAAREGGQPAAGRPGWGVNPSGRWPPTKAADFRRRFPPGEGWETQCRRVGGGARKIHGGTPGVFFGWGRPGPKGKTAGGKLLRTPPTIFFQGRGQRTPFLRKRALWQRVGPGPR